MESGKLNSSKYAKRPNVFTAASCYNTMEYGSTDYELII